jgi:hypothetical protein
MYATDEEAGSNPLMLLKRNRVNPYFRPMRASRPQGRLMEVRVEERGESERRSVMDRIGVATSSRAKASRLPQGLSSQENDQNPLNGRKANERCTIGRSTFQSKYESERGGWRVKSGGRFRSVVNGFEHCCAGAVHASRSLIIAHGVSLCIELAEGDVGFQELLGVIK